MEPTHIKTVTLNGEQFTHVKTREYTPVSIFKGPASYLRIGPKELLLPELELHEKLAQLGFPVPHILERGQWEGLFFYRETSLGDVHPGELFAKEYAHTGQISDTHFCDFLSLSKAFGQAQLRTATSENSFSSLCHGILAHELIKELPSLAEQITVALEKVRATTSTLPSVLTHGDLNAYNLFRDGVIDFGSSFEAPAGYDLISNAYHTYLFPSESSFERLRGYVFSTDQMRAYFDSMDTMYVENGHPKLTEFVDTFLFCRSIWSSARMQAYPKIQAWRYAKFDRILKAYLSDRSVLKEAMID